MAGFLWAALHEAPEPPPVAGCYEAGHLPIVVIQPSRTVSPVEREWDMALDRNHGVAIPDGQTSYPITALEKTRR